MIEIDDYLSTETGGTYKLRAPEITEHAIYFTIVGREKPEAFFVNSKEMKSISFSLTTALMTSYSHRIADGVDIRSVIEDMKENFDPSGKYMITGSELKGEATSLINHMGQLLEKYVDKYSKENSDD